MYTMSLSSDFAPRRHVGVSRASLRRRVFRRHRRAENAFKSRLAN